MFKYVSIAVPAVRTANVVTAIYGTLFPDSLTACQLQPVFGVVVKSPVFTISRATVALLFEIPFEFVTFNPKDASLMFAGHDGSVMLGV